MLQGRRVCTSYGQFKNDWFSKALWRTDYSIGFGQRILIPSGGRHASMGGADHRGKSHMAGHSPLTRFQAPSGSGGAAPYAATSNGDASDMLLAVDRYSKSKTIQTMPISLPWSVAFSHACNRHLLMRTVSMSPSLLDGYQHKELEQVLVRYRM